MHKKFSLWLISGLLLILITAPTHGQNIQTIQLPPLQPITAENIGNLQLLGTLENFADLAGTFVTNFAISPNHQWLVVNLFGGILVYDLNNNLAGLLGISTDLGIGGFSNDSAIYLMPQNTGTLIYDTASWTIIGTLPDGFVVEQVRFSPDDSIVAVTHEHMIPGYMGGALDGIYLFETDTWTQINLIPLDLSVQRYLPFAFQTNRMGNFLITHNVVLVYQWDYLNVTNYANPERASKSAMIALLEARTYPAPNSIGYEWVGYANSNGQHALWLTAPDGNTIFAKSDGTYEDVVAGESGIGHDENGIPEIYNDYTRMARPQITQLLLASQAGEVSFGTPTGNVVIVSRDEANQTAQTFTYDATTDTLINHQEGITYTTEEIGTLGAFVDSDNVERFIYRLDEFPVPASFEVGLTLNTYGYTDTSISTSGNYILGSNEERDVTVHNFNTGQKTVLEGLTRDMIEESFTFQMTPDENMIITILFERSQNSNVIQAWDTDTGALLQVFTSDTFRGVAQLSADGQLLVIGGGQVKDRIEFWGVPQP